ncbi:MAG: hypothetical protein LBS85_01680 [Clostridiales Family XIII bacterium]|nr:hypothetical protein [Clostridiales Family XIII bacterium]
MAAQNTEQDRASERAARRNRRSSAAYRGFAARPEPARKPRRRRAPAAPRETREAERHPAAQIRTLSGAEIRAVILIMVVVTGVAMAMIFLAAQAAVIQQDINHTKKEMAQIEEDIVSIKVEIEQAQNIEAIRDRAVNELGMQAPKYDQYIYLSELPDPQQEFAQYLKGKVYGTAQEPEEQ